MKFLNGIADVLYRNRSNAWKAAVATAVFTFVATVLGATMTLFSSLQDWIGDGDTEALLEELKVAGKLTLSAFIALWAGIVNYLFRLVQSKTSLPGEGPTYGSPD